MNRYQISHEIIEELCKLKAKQCLEFLDEKFRGTYPLLRILKESNGGVSAGKLAKELNVSTARIAVILCNLELKKLITKQKSNEDARKTIVLISEKGKEIVDQIDKEVIEYFLKGFEKLDDEDLSKLKEIIIKLQGGNDA